MSGQRHTPEFKDEAVRQVIERGYAVGEVAQRIGVSKHSLYKWVNAVKPNGDEEQAEELAQAKREILKLRADMRRWTDKHLLTLRASIGAGVTYEQSAPASIVAGVLGAATFLFLFMIIPIYVTGAPDMSFQLIATIVSGTAYGWLAGRFLVCMVTDSLQMSKLARALPDLDLLDLGSLSPFVQQGLKSVLPLVIVLIITSHLYIAPGSAVIGASAFLLIWCALTVVEFTLPVRGIHDRISVEKQAQLEKVRTQIRDAWEQVVDRRDASAGDWLSALLDLEMRLERVRAWPYDTSIWLKFGLYMLLGLGSWFGAAAVERLLNSLL